MRSTYGKILLATLLVLILGNPAYARVSDEFSNRYSTVETVSVKIHGTTLAQAPKFSLDQAVAKVRRLYGGTVIKAETKNQGGRPVHRIKILTEDGKVRTVRVDGNDGRIL